MGIETTPDVEESTEPPICASTESTLSSPAAAARSSCEKCEIDQAQPNTIRADQNVPSDTHQHRSIELSEGVEKEVKNAHLLEPSELAALLQTDLEYVLTQCHLEDYSDEPFLSNGLSNAEADLRLKEDGPNVVREFKGVSIWGILLRQVSNSLTIVSVHYEPHTMRWETFGAMD